MGIIAALKKRYKYLYLKDVLDFYELEENAKSRKKEQAGRLRRGAAGVSYGNPAHLLDAANYVKTAWDSITSTTIKNAFIKVDLMRLEGDIHEENRDNDLFSSVMQAMENLNISIEHQELEDFVHVDDENSEEFAAAVLEDVEEMLETMRVVEEAEPDVGSDSEERNSSMANPVVFHGFDSLYKSVLDIEDQLLCKEVKTEAGESFDDLQKSFESLHGKIRTLCAKARRKRLQDLCQMTIHDTLLRYEN